MSWKISIGCPVRRARIVRPIAQAWLLLVIAGSLQPVRPRPVAGLHHEIHWLAFAGAALLLLLLSRNRRQEIRSVIALCLLALSLEYLQHLVYRTAMEWRDVRADSLAILAALALYRLAGYFRSRAPAASTIGHVARSSSP
ncbi:MAG: hypothetical protein LAP87_03215 [Acidobacteriia bacterium]|nr:hypothetical protein [Terriglobia bacterium]